MTAKPKSLIAVAKKGDLILARRLLRDGSDPNTRDAEGMTALMWAAAKGQPKMVHVLLDQEADPHAQDHAGQTALHHAVTSKHRKVIHALVEGKADVNAKDHDDCSPFDLAVLADDYETAKYLSDLGAKDEPPDPGVISIGLSPAGSSHPPVQETIELLSLRLSELPAHNLWGEKGHLRMTFFIPEARGKPAFDGVRKKPLSKKKRILEVQAAIPRSLTKKRPMEFLLQRLNEAVDLAEPTFRRARIEFPASVIREHLDAIGVMKNWEFPDFGE
jgi:Ankyrin repeats (3 copies)